MTTDLEKRSTEGLENSQIEDLEPEEEQENAEGPDHFIGKRVYQIADQFPAYIGKRFVSALIKKGIPLNSYYSTLSNDQTIFLNKLYEKCEDIMISKEAENDQIYFDASRRLV